MSLQRTPDATLRGWWGPHYPEGIDQLAEALLAGHFDPRKLGRISARLPSFVRCCHLPAVADGYMWLSGLEFSVDGYRILVGVPCERGRALDRAPAIYTVRKPNMHMMSIIVRDLTNVLVLARLI